MCYLFGIIQISGKLFQSKAFGSSVKVVTDYKFYISQISRFLNEDIESCKLICFR